MSTHPPGSIRLGRVFAILWAPVIWCSPAFAQDPGVPATPPLPSAAVPPAAPARPPDPVLERLRKMEERLDQVTRQNEQLSRENKRLGQQYKELLHEVKGSETSDEETPGGHGGRDGGDTASGTKGRDDGGTGSGKSGSDEGGTAASAGGGSKSGGGDPTTTGRAQGVGNPRLGKLPIKAYYDWENDGFVFSARDNEITVGVRAMTQVDARIYDPANQFPVSGGIYNPRSRFYFEGHFTKPIEYEFSFQNFYDTVQLLDAYINFNYDPRFQLRIGRYKTPFTYEWYRIHIWDLLAPERSLFASNYEGNRRFGLMGWGSVFDQRMEYAVGTFDTQRNSLQPFNNRQDVMAFLNFKPFYNREEGFLLRDLNFGGSVDAGNENQPLNPAVLRTNLGSPATATLSSVAAVNTAGVPFLAFNQGVIERGLRALWELHAACYRGGLSLIGAWQGGYESYATGQSGPTSRIPIGGFFTQVGYLITGETLRDRTLIEPLHPFDLRHGRFGLGAIELTARYSLLDLDRRVFTDGLADPNLWTNRAQMTDVGFNWYLSKFVKVYFDWEHEMFAQSVYYRPGKQQITNDLFWVRFQVYF